jgi:3-methyladenine DNA glycosylase AlkD
MNAPLELTKAVRRDLEALPRRDAPSVRVVRRRYSKALQGQSPNLVLRFARSLLKGAGWAERVVACETLASHPAALGLLDDQLVEELAEGLSDWGSVDLFAVTVLGQAWREGRVTDSKISSWTRSPDRWRRRLALVATVPLNSRARGGRGDVRRTLRVCRALLKDRDDMVVKAMSWALRELAKRHPRAVSRFVRDEEDRLASRTRREVLNKLRTGLKSPSRRVNTKTALALR